MLADDNVSQMGKRSKNRDGLVGVLVWATHVLIAMRQMRKVRVSEHLAVMVGEILALCC